MGPIGCPETSVTNYQSTLRNIPEERCNVKGKATGTEGKVCAIGRRVDSLHCANSSSSTRVADQHVG
jgi:hypothetical protein